MANIPDDSYGINIDTIQYEDFNNSAIWSITNPSVPAINVENNGRRLSIDSLPRYPCYRAKRIGSYNAFTLSYYLTLLELQKANPNDPPAPGGWILGGEAGLFLITDNPSVNCHTNLSNTSLAPNGIRCFIRRVSTETIDVIEFWLNEYLLGVRQGYSYAIWGGNIEYVGHELLNGIHELRFTKTEGNLQCQVFNSLGTRVKNFNVSLSTTPSYSYYIATSTCGQSGGPNYTATLDMEDFSFS